MALREPRRTNVTRLHPRKGAKVTVPEHAWLVPHLISLIDYAERHDLPEVERALALAAEAIAPVVQKPAADPVAPPRDAKTQATITPLVRLLLE